MTKFLFILFTLLTKFSFSQWIQLNSGTNDNLTSVYFFDNDTGWVAGGNGSILKTTDGGTTWSSLSSGTTQILTRIQFVDSKIGYSSGHSGTILKTTNGGNSWTNISYGTKHLYALQFLNKDTGFVLGQNAFYKTVNGGNTWSDLSFSLNSYFDLHFFDYYTGLTSGIGGTDALEKTINSGSSFFSAWPYSASSIYDIFFTNSNIGYLSSLYLGDSYIQKTYNGGQTWDTTFIVQGFLVTKFNFPTASIGYAVGSNGTSLPILIKSADSGLTWSVQQSSATGPLSDIFFTDSITGYAVGSNGTIIKTTSGGVGIQENTLTTDYKLFPNPTDNNLFVSYQSPDETNFTITNSLGVVLSSGVLKNNSSIDISFMHSGIYFISLSNKNGFTLTKKIIKE